ncbi:NUDIX domain-containing protein [Kitasatospora sp. NPDC003701]
MPSGSAGTWAAPRSPVSGCPATCAPRPEVTGRGALPWSPALLLHDGHLALIRRERPDGLQHSLSGGLVEDGEDAATALRGELLEELGLDLGALPEPPVLCFVQEQETRRPGETALLRRRHLVFTARLPGHLHRAVAAVEQDDPGRAPVLWLPLTAVAGLHLCPAVGPVLHRAAEPAAGPALPAPMTGDSYRWR